MRQVEDPQFRSCLSWTCCRDVVLFRYAHAEYNAPSVFALNDPDRARRPVPKSPSRTRRAYICRIASSASRPTSPPTDLENMVAKPVIVLIPGSFSISAMYFPLQDILVKEGYEVFVNNLPSASRNGPEAPASLSDDAKFFSAIIRKIADQGKDIVVFAHSYGGLVASESAKGHSKEERCAGGLKGGIIRIVFLAAIVLQEGQSLAGHQGQFPPSIIKTDEVRAADSYR